jgi:hypothetical protein
MRSRTSSSFPNGSLGKQAETRIVYGRVGNQIGIAVEEDVFKGSKRELANVLLHEFGHAITDNLRLNLELPRGFIKRESRNLKYIMRSEITAEALALALLNGKRPDAKAQRDAQKWLRQQKDGYKNFGGRGVLIVEYKNEIAIPDPEVELGPGTENAPVRGLTIETVEGEEIRVSPYKGTSVRLSGVCGRPGVHCEFNPDGTIKSMGLDYSAQDNPFFLPPDLAGKLDTPRSPTCTYKARPLAEYKRDQTNREVLTLFLSPPMELHLIPLGQVLGFENPGSIDRILASQPDSGMFYDVTPVITPSGVTYIGSGGGRKIEIIVDPE